MLTLIKKKKFQTLKNFKYKHLAHLNENKPIVIVYTDIYILEHKNVQKKILDDLGVENNINEKIETIQVISQRETERKKEEFFVTFGKGYEQLDYDGVDDYCYTGNNISLPFSYIKNINLKEKLNIPLYMDWDFISENYNREIKQKIPFLQKAFVPSEKGELILTDQKLIKNQKGIVGDVLKKMAKLIFTGQGLVKMSLPVRIFDTKTQLQKIADFFTNLDYLNKAYESKNKLDKLKNIIIFITTCVYYGMGIKKPFNPYIGETFQGYYHDGTEIYIEHVQHDPPKDTFLLLHPEKDLRVYGSLTLTPKLSTNELLINMVGLITVEIKGEKIYCELCEFLNKGMMMGKRRFLLKESFNFYYPNENIKAVIHVGDDKKNLDKFTGGIYLAKKKFNINEKAFKKTIFPEIKKKKFPKDIKPLSIVSGSWYKNIIFDGEELWNSKQECYRVHLGKDVLPSDFRFREDVIWMMYENQKNAGEWKLALELEYRVHRKEREKYKKILKKLMKKKNK